MNSECQGCKSYENKECNVNVTPRLSETEHCPCITCLVKGVCKHSCNDYNNYLALCAIRYTEYRRKHKYDNWM